MKTTISFLLIALLLPALANAEDITVGVERIDYAPYYYIDNDEYKGFAQEWLTAFGKRYKHNIRFRPLPIKRLYLSLFNGEIDFKFPDNQIWAGDTKKGRDVYYSNPVVAYTDGVLRPPATNSPLKTLGIVRGFTPWDYLSAINEGAITVREINSLTALIKLCLDQRIDGAYFNINVANHLLASKLNKPNGLAFAKDLPHTSSHYAISTVKHQKILDEMNQFMKEDAFLEIVKKYGLTTLPTVNNH